MLQKDAVDRLWAKPRVAPKSAPGQTGLRFHFSSVVSDRLLVYWGFGVPSRHNRWYARVIFGGMVKGTIRSDFTPKDEDGDVLTWSGVIRNNGSLFAVGWGDL